MLEIPYGRKVSILLCDTSSDSNGIVMVFGLFFLSFVNYKFTVVTHVHIFLTAMYEPSM
jgi:hypothetical protein